MGSDKYDDQRQKFCRGVLTDDAREKAEAEVMGDLLAAAVTASPGSSPGMSWDMRR